MEVQRAYAQALLVDRAALDGFQEANDALMATQTLKRAFRTDVEPILAMARAREGRAPSTRSPPTAPPATAPPSPPNAPPLPAAAAASSETSHAKRRGRETRPGRLVADLIPR